MFYSTKQADNPCTVSNNLTWINTVVKIFPFIHPNLGQASVVMIDDSRSSPGESIRRGFTKHVSHMGTRGDFHDTTTHPSLYTRTPC